MKKVTKDRISPTTRLTPPITMALAATTTGRRGIAERVDRICPVPYSALMNITPSTPMANWPRLKPTRIRRVGSGKAKGCPCSAFVDSAPSPMVATISEKRLQGVERTDQNFVHSADRAWRSPARPDGSSRSNETGAFETAVIARPRIRLIRRSTP